MAYQIEKVVCNKCNGTKFVNRKNDLISNYFIQVICPKCNGEGTLDWIEQILGKKPTHTNEILNKWADLVAENMAKKIDEDILKEIFEKARK